MATVISGTSFLMVRRIEAACAIVSTRPRCGSFTATTWKPRATGLIWTKWRISDDRGTCGSCGGRLLGHGARAPGLPGALSWRIHLSFHPARLETPGPGGSAKGGLIAARRCWRPIAGFALAGSFGLGLPGAKLPGRTDSLYGSAR